LILCIAINSALAGCVDPPPVVVSDCDWAEPIFPSRDDTPQTKRQILLHNRKGAAHCGWTLPGLELEEE
jgi:hypothetical protein